MVISGFTVDETLCSGDSSQQYAICALSLSIYTSPVISKRWLHDELVVLVNKGIELAKSEEKGEE